jgi:hypothetical protein
LPLKCSCGFKWFSFVPKLYAQVWWVNVLFESFVLQQCYILWNRYLRRHCDKKYQNMMFGGIDGDLVEYTGVNKCQSNRNLQFCFRDRFVCIHWW